MSGNSVNATRECKKGSVMTRVRRQKTQNLNKFHSYRNRGKVVNKKGIDSAEFIKCEE